MSLNKIMNSITTNIIQLHDNNYLFYDIFRSGNSIYGIGPYYYYAFNSRDIRCIFYTAKKKDESKDSMIVDVSSLDVIQHEIIGKRIDDFWRHTLIVEFKIPESLLDSSFHPVSILYEDKKYNFNIVNEIKQQYYVSVCSIMKNEHKILKE